MNIDFQKKISTELFDLGTGQIDAQESTPCAKTAQKVGLYIATFLLWVPEFTTRLVLFLAILVPTELLVTIPYTIIKIFFYTSLEIPKLHYLYRFAFIILGSHDLFLLTILKTEKVTDLFSNGSDNEIERALKSCLDKIVSIEKIYGSEDAAKANQLLDDKLNIQLVNFPQRSKLVNKFLRQFRDPTLFTQLFYLIHNGLPTEVKAEMIAILKRIKLEKTLPIATAIRIINATLSSLSSERQKEVKKAIEEAIAEFEAEQVHEEFTFEEALDRIFSNEAKFERFIQPLLILMVNGSTAQLKDALVTFLEKAPSCFSEQGMSTFKLVARCLSDSRPEDFATAFNEAVAEYESKHPKKTPLFKRLFALISEGTSAELKEEMMVILKKIKLKKPLAMGTAIRIIDARLTSLSSQRKKEVKKPIEEAISEFEAGQVPEEFSYEKVLDRIFSDEAKFERLIQPLLILMVNGSAAQLKDAFATLLENGRASFFHKGMSSFRLVANHLSDSRWEDIVKAYVEALAEHESKHPETKPLFKRLFALISEGTSAELKEEMMVILKRIKQEKPFGMSTAIRIIDASLSSLSHQRKKEVKEPIEQAIAEFKQEQVPEEFTYEKVLDRIFSDEAKFERLIHPLLILMVNGSAAQLKDAFIIFHENCPSCSFQKGRISYALIFNSLSDSRKEDIRNALNQARTEMSSRPPPSPPEYDYM